MARHRQPVAHRTVTDIILIPEVAPRRKAAVQPAIIRAVLPTRIRVPLPAIRITQEARVLPLPPDMAHHPQVPDLRAGAAAEAAEQRAVHVADAVKYSAVFS